MSVQSTAFDKWLETKGLSKQTHWVTWHGRHVLIRDDIVREVPIKSLIPTQTNSDLAPTGSTKHNGIFVFPETVDKYQQEIRSTGHINPLVVGGMHPFDPTGRKAPKGKLFLYDGHHRYLAAVREGKTTIPVIDEPDYAAYVAP